LPSSSLLVPLLGEQRPRLESRPDAVASYGDLAVDFVTAAGMKLEDWQEYVLWAWHDINEEGDWAASECGLLVSRQNGKSEILVAFDLVRLFLFPMEDGRRRTVLHTAHELKTATGSFEKLAGIIANSDELMDLVEHVYTANGKEAIKLKPRGNQLPKMGDQVRFIARSRKSGRGLDASDIVYDEAQELSTQNRSALTYTQSTVRNRQEVFVGTVPGEEDDSEVWEGIRDRGRSGTSPRTAWQEWSPKGAEDPDLAETIDVEDREVWRQGIPALGLWIHPDTVGEQVDRATDRGELLRERFSVWPNRRPAEQAKLSELDMQAWKNSAREDAGVSGGTGIVLALALGRGGSHGTIAKAKRVDDDHIAVEHAHTDRGTRWIAAHLKKLKAELGNALVVLDAKNAAPVLSSLERAGIKYLSMNIDELAAAHALFLEHVNAGLVPHRDQPEVTRSLELATTRPLGRAGVTWEQSDPTKPVSHAQAVTWAHWGVLKSEATPKKELPPLPPPGQVIRTGAGIRDESNLAEMAF
jgi:hypothetical protein